VTTTGQLVLVAAAVATLALGAILNLFTAALAGVALGVAEGTVRATYRRALTAKVRRIGH
jgi:Na+/alanine symporter